MIKHVGHGYVCDTKTSLLFPETMMDDFKALPENKIAQMSKLRYLRKEQQMRRRDKKLTSIKLWGYGLITCPGTCDYCYKHLEEASNPCIAEEQQVTPAYLDKVMKETKEFRTDDTYISFFGSSIFNHPQRHDIIETLKTNNDKYLTLSFVDDMMLTEEKFKDSMCFIEEVASDPFIKTIMLYITLDLGSTSRNSKYLSIDNEEIIQRGKRIVDRFGTNNKVCIVFKSNFGKLTNMDKFRRDVDEFSQLPCVLMFSPVSHDVYEPTVEMMDEIIAYIGERKTHVMFRGEILLNTGEASKRFFEAFKSTEPQMMELTNGVFCDNAIITCQAYSTMLSVRNNTTSACCYDYLSENENGKDSFVLSEVNEADKDKLVTLPEHCLVCDNVGVCGQCVPRRAVYKCTEHPALMYWETYIWERRCREYLDGVLDK